MRRFAFGLERVLEVRAYKERLAEAVLAEKSGVCAALQMKLEDNARATLVAGRERCRPGGNAADYRAGELYAVRLSQDRDRLMKALALAEAERESARLVFVEVSMSRQVVTKLRDREEAAYYKLISREEIKMMDELASGARERLKAGRP
ncbi:MAG TPA: flagellar export protein FliJ [bacterium]|nr:flagellar export protein FliJ [bacterium]